MLKISDLVFLSIQIDYVQMLSFVVAAEREYLDHVFFLKKKNVFFTIALRNSDTIFPNNS